MPSLPATLTQHQSMAAEGFRVGDLVTRDGTDLHRVIAAEWRNGYPPDLIDVICIKAPLGFLNEDGITRGEPWCKVGEVESNVAWRYQRAGEVIEVTPDLPSSGIGGS